MNTSSMNEEQPYINVVRNNYLKSKQKVPITLYSNPSDQKIPFYNCPKPCGISSNYKISSSKIHNQKGINISKNNTKFSLTNILNIINKTNSFAQNNLNQTTCTRRKINQSEIFINPTKNESKPVYHPTHNKNLSFVIKSKSRNSQTKNSKKRIEIKDKVIAFNKGIIHKTQTSNNIPINNPISNNNNNQNMNNYLTFKNLSSISLLKKKNNQHSFSICLSHNNNNVSNTNINNSTTKNKNNSFHKVNNISNSNINYTSNNTNGNNYNSNYYSNSRNQPKINNNNQNYSNKSKQVSKREFIQKQVKNPILDPISISFRYKFVSNNLKGNNSLFFNNTQKLQNKSFVHKPKKAIKRASFNGNISFPDFATNNNNSNININQKIPVSTTNDIRQINFPDNSHNNNTNNNRTTNNSQKEILIINNIPKSNSTTNQIISKPIKISRIASRNHIPTNQQQVENTQIKEIRNEMKSTSTKISNEGKHLRIKTSKDLSVASNKTKPNTDSSSGRIRTTNVTSQNNTSQKETESLNEGNSLFDFEDDDEPVDEYDDLNEIVRKLYFYVINKKNFDIFGEEREKTTQFINFERKFAATFNRKYSRKKLV